MPFPFFGPVNSAAFHAMTQEDQDIHTWRVGRNGSYEYRIADRNDAAIMHARTTLAMNGCPRVRDHVMPVR